MREKEAKRLGNEKLWLGEGPVWDSIGIAFSPDNRIMYHIDTPSRKIDSYDFDPETGGVSNKRTAVRIE